MYSSEQSIACMGPFKCYVTQMGVGGVTFAGKKHYEGVMYNVISVTRGCVGVQLTGKKRYVTLEWPLCNFQTDNIRLHKVKLVV